jgi:hypothetical protein
MNRPKQLNALSGELMGAVVDALRELDADSDIRSSQPSRASASAAAASSRCSAT